MNLKENIKKGQIGENIAEKYLINLGYKIIERNWRYSKNAEIDIIAKEGDTLVFVEVKTRTSLNFGHPFEAVNKLKQQKVLTGIYGYLNTSKHKYKNFRFDVIAVIGLNSPKIEHIKNVGQF